MKENPARSSLQSERTGKSQPIKASDAVETVFSPVDCALAIPEIVANILHYYPLSGIRGQNNVMTVSKSWHRILKESDFIEDASFEKLIDDCLRYPEGVIQILKDETLRPYLTTEKLIRIISCHKEFALHLLRNTNIKDWSVERLAMLAKYHCTVSMHILNEKFKEKHSEALLQLLGRQHPVVADLILDTPSLVNRIDPMLLVDANPKITMRVLGEPATYDTLSRDTFSGPIALYRYLDVMLKIGKTKQHFTFLNDLQINTPEEFVCNLETICNRGLNINGLIKLAKFHEDVAMKILMTPAIYKKIPEESIVTLGKYHAKAAMYILASESLSAYLKVENVPKINDLQILSKKHASVAKYIFSTPALCEHLNNAHIADIASESHEMAMYVLKEQALCELFESKDFVTLGNNNPTVTKYILSTPEIYKKMKAGDIVTLGSKHPLIVLKILKTDELRNKVDDNHLKNLECIEDFIPFVLPAPLQQQIYQQAQLWNAQTNDIGIKRRR